MDELISIIVPVYNVKKYLTSCLDSIKNQSYRTLEVILIDDGSTDGSSDICDYYKEQDPRFIVFHNSNQGVSSARNDGLSHVNGDWVMFLDSDDLLTPNALEAMLRQADVQNADIVGCSFSYFYGNGIELPFLDNHVNSSIIDCDCRAIVHDMLIYPEKVRQYYPTCLVPWGKIIKKEIIDKTNLCFDNRLFLHEDALFNSRLFLNCKKQSVLGEPLILYRQRKNSASKSNNKDYFANNKIFCNILNEELVDSNGEKIISIDEYSFLCAKYFSYALINVCQATSFSYYGAKKYIEKYLTDTCYSNAFKRLRGKDLTPYDITNRLEKTIKYAINRNTNMLILAAFSVYVKRWVRSNSPVGKHTLFE